MPASLSTLQHVPNCSKSTESCTRRPKIKSLQQIDGVVKRQDVVPLVVYSKSK